MANHTLHTTPVFDENLRKYETEDEVHADVFNAVDEKLINNDYYLKKNLDDVMKKSGEHRENNEIHVTKKQKEEWSAKAENTEVTKEKKGLMSPTDKTKLDGIATNAEVNQNAFSNVKVGGTTVAANGKTAAFELVAGTNIKLTADNATKKITINGPSVVTTAANGLMTKEDKIKLNNIANNANNYTHPNTHPASMITGLPTSLPANGGNADTVNNHKVDKDVPANATFTDTTYPYYNKAIDNNFATKFRTQTKGNTAQGNYISNVRAEVSNINFAPQYGSGLAWGSFDTHGYLGVSYSGADAYIGGGNADKLNWVKRILLEGDSIMWENIVNMPSSIAAISVLSSEKYSLLTHKCEAGAGPESGFVIGTPLSGNNFQTTIGCVGLGDYVNIPNRTNGSIAIGHMATVTGDFQAQIGNASTTTYTYGAVQNRSDRRDKIDIQDTKLGLDFLLKIKPRQFRWNYRNNYIDYKEIVNEKGEKTITKTEFENDGSKSGKRYHQGVIAQEVKAVMDDMGVDFAGYQDHKVNGGGDVLSIGYTEFIAPLIKAVQELNEKIEELKDKVKNRV